MRHHRPSTIRVLLLGLVALLMAGAPRAQALPATDPVLSALGQGLWLLPGRFPRDRQPDGNSLVIEAPEGLIVVDTGRHAEHARALLDFAARRGHPIVSVINTHWHLDHLGGNARLRDARPQLEVIASPAVARAISEQFPGFRKGLEAMLADPKTTGDLREMVLVDIALYDRAAALMPTRAVDDGDRTLVLAGRELRIGQVSGPSDGDLWVFDPASRVLAVGDLVTLPVPFLDTACPAQWRTALARVDTLPFERAVPGHGPVLDRALWQRWRSGFERLLDCAAGDAPPRSCSARWIEDMGPLLASDAHAQAHGMLGHYIAERLRSAERERYCAPR